MESTEESTLTNKAERRKVTHGSLGDKPDTSMQNNVTVPAQDSVSTSTDRPIQYVLDSVPLSYGEPLGSYTHGHYPIPFKDDFQNRRIYQLEEDLRIVKVSICNVLNAFCNLPNTTVPTELQESIEQGTISAMVLFLGRLVERLENYRLQEANYQEMRDLLEDTSSTNCTLITEKDMMHDEILSIIETSDTYEEVKSKLVTMLNRSDRLTEQNRVRKRRRISVDLPNQKKPKRVRSSQLRSRHPMYETSSRTMTQAFSFGKPTIPIQITDTDPDVIEVSSKDGDSDENPMTENTEFGTIASQSETGDPGQPRSCTSGTKETDHVSSSRVPRGKRGQYFHYDKSTKLEIAKYASEHGSSKAARHFTIALGQKINESTVRHMLQRFYKGVLKEDDVVGQSSKVKKATPSRKSLQIGVQTFINPQDNLSDDSSLTTTNEYLVKTEEPL